MNFLPPEIEEYVEKHTKEESDLLKTISRETYAKVLMPRMLSGHLQGRVLSMFSKMIRPQNILEIGTYTGYSAICFAEGLQENGKLITIDINEELETTVRAHFNNSKYAEKIEYRIGNALTIIPELTQKFDLVFIDADKINYSTYFDLVFDKLNAGGFILADNVLWSGKILMDAAKMDEDTKAINDFNKKITADSRVENVLLPIRDGIMAIRKK
ncbi:MAG: O-methyltransferase [Bacteroidetes bacterium]|nr:O-methyltransferase [Bacteroidota bacterium]